MKRKLIFFLFYSALTTLALSVWHHFFGLPLVRVSPLQAFHTDIPAIIHYPCAKDALSTSDSSGMAANLAFTQSLHEASVKMKLILRLNLFPDSLPLYVGMHNVGRNNHNFSAVIPLQHHVFHPDSLSFHPNIKRIIPSSFHRHQIFTVYLNDNSAFALAHYRNLLIISNVPLLVEDAIGSLTNKSSSLLRNAAFLDVLSPPDNPGTQQLFIQTKRLPALLNGTILNQAIPEIQRWASLIQWIRLDIQDHKLRGTFIAPEKAQWPKAIRKQAVQANFFPVIPDNVALLFSASIKNWRNFSPASSPLFDQYIAPWSGRDAAVAIAPPRGIDIPGDWFIILPIHRQQLAAERLNQLADHTGILKDYQYNAFQIRQLLTPSFFPILPDEWIPNPFFTTINDFAIFASSQAALEVWLDAYISGKTLANNEAFLALNANTPKPGNWQFYLAAEKMNVQLKSAAPNDTRLPTIANLLGNLMIHGQPYRNGWRFSGLFNRQFHTPIHSDIAWKTLLSAPALSPPFPIHMPAANETCIAIQDQQFRVYLIGPSGDIRWSRLVDGPIISNIQVLDDNANIIFNTSHNIYVVNSQGQDIGNFPLPLQSPATNGLSVVNFDGGNQIGFFIACNNGNAYGFDRQGRPLPGWNPLPDIGIVKLPIIHFAKDNKDYLITLNDRQVIQLFARDGSLRFPPKTLEGPFLSIPKFQLSASSNRIVAINSSGKAHIIGLNNEHFNLLCPVGLNKQVKFEFADVSGDDRKEYIVISEQQLAVYGYNAKNQFINILNFAANDPLQDVFAIALPNYPKSLIGAVSQKSGKIFLLNDKGELLPGFPLAGHHPFFVADLYRNGQQLAISAYSDSVYAFIIQ